MECNRCSPILREMMGCKDWETPHSSRQSLEDIIAEMQYLYDKCGCKVLGNECMPLTRLRIELNEQNQ